MAGVYEPEATTNEPWMMNPLNPEQPRAGSRFERRLTALQVIEALRMHAAANKGRLPKSLDEIGQVPVPTDPFVGKPFPYRLEGDTAVLESLAPPGKPARHFARQYEIKVTLPQP